MTATLTYVIKYVGNMEKAVRVHREQLGLKLRFDSPHWSEFEIGSTALELATTLYVAETREDLATTSRSAPHRQSVE